MRRDGRREKRRSRGIKPVAFVALTVTALAVGVELTKRGGTAAVVAAPETLDLTSAPPPAAGLSAKALTDTELAAKIGELRPPLAISFRDPAFPTVEGRKIDWKRAESRIRARISKARRLRSGVVIKDLSTGRTVQFNPDLKFASASLVKVPVVMALYEDFRDRRLDPRGSAKFLERHRAGGSGWLKGEPSGKEVLYRDLIYMMLAKSDNTATNILVEAVGKERVTRFCEKNGWKRTNLVRDVMDLHLRRRGIENWTTPREMAAMMEGLYAERIVSPEASRDMLRFMTNPPIRDRIPRKLPLEIDVVHKTGLIYDNAHDVGIVYLPGEQPVLVVALVDRIGTRYRDAKDFIGDIAKILYEESLAAPSI